MKTSCKLTLITFLSALSCFVSAQTIDVQITNIRNTNGQLYLAIFADPAGFKAEKPCWVMKCSKKNIVNGEFHIQIPFKSGKFGLSVLDDEDQTGKMEYGFLGIPKKGFGFSDYYLKGLTKPVFDDFKFNIQKNETKKLFVKMKYF